MKILLEMTKLAACKIIINGHHDYICTLKVGNDKHLHEFNLTKPYDSLKYDSNLAPYGNIIFTLLFLLLVNCNVVIIMFVYWYNFGRKVGTHM